MKKIIFISYLILSSCGTRDMSESVFFVPDSCNNSVVDFLQEPYNERDAVSYRIASLQSMPKEYENGVFFKITYPKGENLETSIQANIHSILESCSLNSFVRLSRKEFDFNKLDSLISDLGGTDEIVIKMTGEDVIIYFSRSN